MVIFSLLYIGAFKLSYENKESLGDSFKGGRIDE